MVPALGSMKRLMQFSAVVLPAPFGPMRPWIVLGWTVKLTSCSAWTPPKSTDRFSIARCADERFDAGPLEPADVTTAKASGDAGLAPAETEAAPFGGAAATERAPRRRNTGMR